MFSCIVTTQSTVVELGATELSCTLLANACQGASQEDHSRPGCVTYVETTRLGHLQQAARNQHLATLPHALELCRSCNTSLSFPTVCSVALLKAVAAVQWASMSAKLENKKVRV